MATRTPAFRKGDRASFKHDDGRVIEGTVTVGRTKDNCVKIHTIEKFHGVTSTPNPNPALPAGRTYTFEEHTYTVPRVEKYELKLIAKRR